MATFQLSDTLQERRQTISIEIQNIPLRLQTFYNIGTGELFLSYENRSLPRSQALFAIRKLVENVNLLSNLIPNTTMFFDSNRMTLEILSTSN